jgi:hypothetical protein
LPEEFKMNVQRTLQIAAAWEGDGEIASVRTRQAEEKGAIACSDYVGTTYIGKRKILRKNLDGVIFDFYTRANTSEQPYVAVQIENSIRRIDEPRLVADRDGCVQQGQD